MPEDRRPVMLWGIITAADDLMHRHARLLDAIGIVGFVLGCASYAGFLRLPTLVVLPAALGTILAVLRYAVWDGFVTPRLEARREQRDRGP
ncbi:hypothetical protein IP88_16160 [alpha proteobacterium AAP81b]|nr:hypothetical protein IP88_16160 [alpha proteobacterium AAP81b]